MLLLCLLQACSALQLREGLPPEEDTGGETSSPSPPRVMEGVLWWGLIFYMFIAQAEVCDLYFVESIKKFVQLFKIPEDLAGATLMALGCNGPELFVNILGIFVTKTEIGAATIVGSEIFNLMCIVGGACLVSPGGELIINKVPFYRDCAFYFLSILLLGGVLFDQKVTFYESLVLFFCAIAYGAAVKYTPLIYQKVLKTPFPEAEKVEEEEENEENEKFSKIFEVQIKIEEKTKSLEEFDFLFLYGLFDEYEKSLIFSSSLENLEKFKKMKNAVVNPYFPLANGNQKVKISAKSIFFEKNEENTSPLLTPLLQESRGQNVVQETLISRKSSKNYKNVIMESPTVESLRPHSHSRDFDEKVEINEKKTFFEPFKTASSGDTSENSKNTEMIPIFLDFPGKSDENEELSKVFFGDLFSKSQEICAQSPCFLRISSGNVNIENKGKKMDLKNENYENLDKFKTLLGSPFNIFLELNSKKSILKFEKTVFSEISTSCRKEIFKIRKSLKVLNFAQKGVFKMFFCKLEIFLKAPIDLLLAFSIGWSSPRLNHDIWVFCFLLSMFWLAVFSYFLCLAADGLHSSLHISQGLLGVTVCAIGTSFPNFRASYLMAKEGRSTLAIANALGSNVQNIFLALALPWLVFDSYPPYFLRVEARSILKSVGWMLGTLGIVVAFSVAGGGKMGKKCGFLFFLVYFVYLWDAVYH